METHWKPVTGYEGLYEVSDDGRVRAMRRPGREMSQRLTHKGYPRVVLNRDGTRRRMVVHRLVAKAFLPPSDLPMVRHLNDVKTDNRVSNLAWGSAAENTADMLRISGHWNSRKTVCVHGHAFTEENTRITKRGRRDCRTCARIQGVARNRIRRAMTRAA